MATKMIKFDLQMKGVKVTNIEELQENFNADILPIFQTGRLAKWLMSRELIAQAEAVTAIDKNSTELQQLAAICQALELDDDEEVLQFLLDERPAAQTAQTTATIPAAAVSDVADEDSSIPPSSGVDWSNKDMSNRHFIGDNLRNANLRNTNFQNADLSLADLTGADLSMANLYCANLMGANLTDADLTGANLEFAKIEKSNFKSANLTNARLISVKSFDDNVLSFETGFHFKILEYKSKDNSKAANFSCSNLTGANLQDSIFISDNFTDANLTNANLSKSVLTCSDFTGANLTRATLHRAELHNTNFTNADLSFAELYSANFDSVDENFESLGEKVNLTNAKLTGIIGFERPRIEPAILPLDVDQEVARGPERMFVKWW